MLKRLAFSISLVIAATLTTACAPIALPTAMAPAASTPVPLPEIDLCLYGNTTAAIFTLADEKGVFEKNGVSVNVVTLSSNANAASALVAGDVDICHTNPSPFVGAILAGEDLVITAGTINQMFYTLVARAEIETPQDLQGKALGSSGVGGGAEAYLRMALPLAGVDPDRDVTILNVGQSAERLAAMESGQIAATAILVTDIGAARRLGFHPLLVAADAPIPYQQTAIIMKRDFLARNRDAVLSFTQALVEAIALFKQDRAGAIAALAATLERDPVADADYLGEIYDSYAADYLERIPYPTEAGLALVIEEARREVPNAPELLPTSIVDRSLVESLELDGFIERLYQEK